MRVRVVDLSDSGCFVATEMTLDLGLVVEVVLQLPGRTSPVRIAGQVVRVSGPRDDHIGFAIEFAERLEDAPAA